MSSADLCGTKEPDKKKNMDHYGNCNSQKETHTLLALDPASVDQLSHEPLQSSVQRFPPPTHPAGAVTSLDGRVF